MTSDKRARSSDRNPGSDRKRQRSALSQGRGSWRSSTATRLKSTRRRCPQIQQRITYILNLFPSELHIFVRPEIRSLADLAGKKVNFNTQGTAAAYSGPLIFSRLGLDVEKIFIPHPVALEQTASAADDMLPSSSSRRSPSTRSSKGKWDDRLQVPACRVRSEILGLLCRFVARVRGLSQPDREGRAHRHHRGSHRSRIVQLATGDAALSPGRTLRGRVLRPGRQIEVARIRSEMEGYGPEEGRARH